MKDRSDEPSQHEQTLLPQSSDISRVENYLNKERLKPFYFKIFISQYSFNKSFCFASFYSLRLIYNFKLIILVRILYEFILINCLEYTIYNYFSVMSL